MWWKLVGLFVITTALVFAVIPIRTHALVYDPINEPAPERSSLGQMVSNMYLTPDTLVLILLILAVASFVAFKVVRGRW